MWIYHILVDKGKFSFLEKITHNLINNSLWTKRSRLLEGVIWVVKSSRKKETAALHISRFSRTIVGLSLNKSWSIIIRSFSHLHSWWPATFWQPSKLPIFASKSSFLLNLWSFALQFQPQLIPLPLTRKANQRIILHILAPSTKPLMTELSLISDNWRFFFQCFSLVERMGILILIVGLCLFVSFVIWIIYFMKMHEDAEANLSTTAEPVWEDGGEIFIVRDPILRPRRRMWWCFPTIYSV